MTINEYNILLEANKLRQIDIDYRNHLQAFLGVAAGATNKQGKPIYKKFEKFFDYKKAIQKAKGVEEKDKRFEKLKAYLRNKEEA